MSKPACYCGTATKSPHELGTCGCVRFVVEAPKRVGVHPETGCPMWDTGDGKSITEYTLFSQRGYYEHPDGTWSRRPGSVNSMDFE